MEAVTGIFKSSADAQLAVQRLRAIGIEGDHHLNLLMPGSSIEEISHVPTSDTEQPGMGTALGGFVGGVSGMALGPAVTSLLIPGIGPIAAVGIVATALLTAGGVIAGAAAGSALEDSMSDGLPKDELFLYEDALRQGRTVVIALTDDDDKSEATRKVLTEAGAESIDAARKQWWIGLRDVEEEHYSADGKDFAVVEPMYKYGFEAALHPESLGKSYEDSIDYLRTSYPSIYNQPAFHRGYERGREHYQKLGKQG